MRDLKTSPGGLTVQVVAATLKVLVVPMARTPVVATAGPRRERLPLGRLHRLDRHRSGRSGNGAGAPAGLVTGIGISTGTSTGTGTSTFTDIGIAVIIPTSTTAGSSSTAKINSTAGTSSTARPNTSACACACTCRAFVPVGRTSFEIQQDVDVDGPRAPPYGPFPPQPGFDPLAQRQKPEGRHIACNPDNGVEEAPLLGVPHRLCFIKGRHFFDSHVSGLREHLDGIGDVPPAVT